MRHALVGGTWMSVITASLFMLLIVPVTTVLSILFVETGGAYRCQTAPNLAPQSACNFNPLV